MDFKIDLKKQFAKWFEPKAPSNYKNWFGENLNEKLDEISNAYKSSFNKSLFELDMEYFLTHISTITNDIANRSKSTDNTIAEYVKKTPNEIPNNVINIYYLEFLECLKPSLERFYYNLGFPKVDHKYDPIEDTKEFQDILPELEAKVESIFKDEPRIMGFCHQYWKVKTDILKKDYGIEWRSPRLMNPHIIYD